LSKSIGYSDCQVKNPVNASNASQKAPARPKASDDSPLIWPVESENYFPCSFDERHSTRTFLTSSKKSLSAHNTLLLSM
jgi:hypothetical protein